MVIPGDPQVAASEASGCVIFLIVGFHGDERSGKSLMATYFAACELSQNDRAVYSNYAIYFNARTLGHLFKSRLDVLKRIEKNPPRKLDLATLILKNLELQDCILIFDEAAQFFDCRSSFSISNKIASYLAYQTEKQGVDMYVIVHNPRFIDYRLRMNTKVMVWTEWIGNKKSPDPSHDMVKWTLLDFRPVIPQKRGPFYTLASPMYRCYDSDKRVPLDPTMLARLSKELSKYMDTNKAGMENVWSRATSGVKGVGA